MLHKGKDNLGGAVDSTAHRLKAVLRTVGGKKNCVVLDNAKAKLTPPRTRPWKNHNNMLCINGLTALDRCH
jgi:hypothetical protein